MSKPVKRSGLLHWLRYNLLEPPYEGLIKGEGSWRVLYPPCEHDPKGGRSVRMGYGNACDYAEMFGGEVIKDTP